MSLILADNSDGSVSKHGDLAAWTQVQQIDEAGGATDLWTETLSLANVQDVDFGFFYGNTVTQESPVADSDVNYLHMRVFFSLASSIQIFSHHLQHNIGRAL